MGKAEPYKIFFGLLDIINSNNHSDNDPQSLSNYKHICLDFSLNQGKRDWECLSCVYAINTKCIILLNYITIVFSWRNIEQLHFKSNSSSLYLNGRKLGVTCVFQTNSSTEILIDLNISFAPGMVLGIKRQNNRFS